MAQLAPHPIQLNYEIFYPNMIRVKGPLGIYSNVGHKDRVKAC